MTDNNMESIKTPVSKWKYSVVSDSLRLHGLYSSWNSPGQNTEVGSLPLLQGIFPTQGLNPGLLLCRQILSQLSHKGRPNTSIPKHQYTQRLLVFVFESQMASYKGGSIRKSI